ncbi:MAG: hypothetical protein RLZZ76_300 [Candidatus Parcubacteria bacterium]|jgi:predicted nucleic acid-binding protein
MSTVHSGNNNALMLEDNLQAGFLLSDQDTTKIHAGFSVISIGGIIGVEYIRDCNSKEKKRIKRMMYSDKCVKSIRTKTTKGDPCQLFVLK